MQLSLQSTIKPQVIQHLHLLQLTTTELQAMIQEKALENPLIDLEESTFDRPSEWLGSAAIKSSNFKAGLEPSFVSKECTKDFLFEQIPLVIEREDRAVLNYLIESLDERLFLTITANDIAVKFGIGEAKARKLVGLLQSFEPVGVGAAGLVDFLVMNIEVDESAPKWAKEFVLYEMKAIAKMDVSRLSKRYKLPVREIIEIIDYIKELPRAPVISLQGTAPYIVPDAFIHKVDQTWLIELNDRATPSLKMQDTYVELLKDGDPQYLQKCMRDYVTLVQGIDYRKKTLYAILDHLVRTQSSYFEHGKSALKPMGLKDVAAALELHESTISRAIKGKYIQTPFGIIAIQELFSKAVGNSTPNEICRLIESFIQNEPKDKPYSDQQIVLLLQEKDIAISRRTVTKYREQLHIPSSQKRAYLI